MTSPYSNTGGKVPPEAGKAVWNRTKIDALTFTARGAMNVPLDLLERYLGKSGAFNVQDPDSGWQGYQYSASLTVDGTNVGRVSWGGKSQRDTVHISLMGTGCAMVGDVAPIVATCARESWPLGRVDIAADFVDGSVSYDTTYAASRRRGFHSGGRPPEINGIGPLDDGNRGRTITIGKRENDKFGRCYEKGLKELPSIIRDIAEDTGIDPGPNFMIQVNGVWINPARWFRAEAELKAKKRPLPWDIVERRDQYFAGCYPYFAEILPSAEPAFILTPDRVGTLALEEVLAHIQRQYGSTLFTALVAYEGDIGALFAKIIGDKHNERLVQAGALLGKLSQVAV